MAFNSMNYEHTGWATLIYSRLSFIVDFENVVIAIIVLIKKENIEFSQLEWWHIIGLVSF